MNRADRYLGKLERIKIFLESKINELSDYSGCDSSYLEHQSGEEHAMREVLEFFMGEANEHV